MDRKKGQHQHTVIRINQSINQFARKSQTHERRCLRWTLRVAKLASLFVVCCVGVAAAAVEVVVDVAEQGSGGGVESYVFSSHDVSMFRATVVDTSQLNLPFRATDDVRAAVLLLRCALLPSSTFPNSNSILSNVWPATSTRAIVHKWSESSRAKVD